MRRLPRALRRDLDVAVMDRGIVRQDCVYEVQQPDQRRSNNDKIAKQGHWPPLNLPPKSICAVRPLTAMTDNFEPAETARYPGAPRP